MQARGDVVKAVMESIGQAAGVSARAPRFLEIFEGQRAAFARDSDPPLEIRLDRLKRLENLLRENMDSIAGAIRDDFGHRSPHETRLLEIFPSLEAIRHARAQLRAWMRDSRRAVSIWFRPGRARVVYQPLGAVGIIVPWNYPIMLAVAPTVAALAAGNRVMLKMSELTPRTSALLAVLASRHFQPEELAVVEGDAAVGQAFAALPFDHLLFTGSTRVGHAIMHAAAENLTPVTLELGGKSPAIIGPDADFRRAVERILIGKCMNAGQTCIAPDYVLLPAGRSEAFIEQARAVVDAAYPDIGRTPDYTSIVSARHFARLRAYLEQAQARGARIVPLSSTLQAPEAGARRFPPLAVLGAPDDADVMQEEIFGPLLPVVEYGELSEAIDYVNSRPRPLALYYFDRDRARIERVVRQTISGGVTINDTILHIAQDDLPFGGVGPSGMGHYHGREGFETFSKAKAVFHQSRLNGIGLFTPPYGRLFDRLTRMLLRQ